jgi:hypothetical protein
MGTEQVLKDIEQTIRRVTRDIRKKKGAVGGDKLSDLAKLVNSYSRLMERMRHDQGRTEDGQPGFHESLYESWINHMNDR